MGHGLCHDLLDRILIEHTVLLGATVYEELHQILVSKFRVPPALWDQLASELCAFEFAPSGEMPLNTPVPDSDDIAILACALAAKADVFVTGDKALLDLRTVEQLPILPPRQVWQRLAGLGND